MVGTGVAGLEAAWVAAERGHRVTVLGRSGEVGGKARVRSLLPGGDALSSIFDYQYAAAQRAGVKFELGVEAGIDDILRAGAETVILATGSTMVAPRWLPDEARTEGWVLDLRSAMAGLVAERSRQGGVAVIFDMDHTEGTYASAQRLREIFDETWIVTPRHSIADETSLVTRQGILRRMSLQGIRIALLSEPRWTDRMESGALEIEQVYTGERTVLEPIAFLAYSTPRLPDQNLMPALRAANIETRLIGDCVMARNIMAATAEGHAAGHAV